MTQSHFMDTGAYATHKQTPSPIIAPFWDHQAHPRAYRIDAGLPQLNFLSLYESVRAKV
ncbi:predicted protein [Botrytis cinerea T4]|uniref:Uncharacterized protein n=1 Tax=Botryotinia fuckeliana (strain T4) TaxID=999810 RepID=G2YD75_BOTF4|nr:predicted protein [Botrytis cinerea T4]